MSVSYELRDKVAVITFDDGKANVYTPDVLTELSLAFTRAAEDKDVTAVLLAGRPGRFSAGFDLATMTSGPGAMRALVAQGGGFAAQMLLHPTPVVAACTGHALAAGALVLLAADYRIGVEGPFQVGLNEVAIGMALPVWAVELARYRMPPSQFDRIILGEVGDPRAAVTAGFLDEVVDGDRLLEAGGATASRLSERRRGAVAGTKAKARTEVAKRMLTGMEEDLASLTGPDPTGR
ncbi:MAG TPA: crotonase/enoyl-CoA hydratase family protein [Acidimicrobiales bacterium]|nr:crotonase/enoyl-CoA hydratase family protein [Acidimicrobiales bacterium]